MNTPLETKGFLLAHTETSFTKYTFTRIGYTRTWCNFLKIVKTPSLSHTPWKGEIMCDKWVYIIDGIIIVEHVYTHPCYY